jgi:D-alanyl-D-alanine carboxypeptidase/D-alanyl-D-alanine-endopeptidase (penicillin-binding protein 4)
LGAATHKDGSLQGGQLARLDQLRALVGNLPPELQLADGCGLSRGNEIQPLLVVEVLRSVLRGKDADAMLSALPVGGESGTLAERFHHTSLVGRVHAKTGWIRGASALSGMIQLGDRLRVFSILMNYDPKRDGLNRDLKSLQDRMVEAIAALPARAGLGQ